MRPSDALIDESEAHAKTNEKLTKGRRERDGHRQIVNNVELSFCKYSKMQLLLNLGNDFRLRARLLHRNLGILSLN
jgi:hypothetical protein